MANYIKVDELFKCETCYHHQGGKCTQFCDAGEAYRPAMSKFFIIEGEKKEPCEHCDTKNYYKDIWDINKLHHRLVEDKMGNCLHIIYYVKEDKYYLKDREPTYIKFEISYCPCCGRRLGR